MPSPISSSLRPLGTSMSLGQRGAAEHPQVDLRLDVLARRRRARDPAGRVELDVVALAVAEAAARRRRSPRSWAIASRVAESSPPLRRTTALASVMAYLRLRAVESRRWLAMKLAHSSGSTSVRSPTLRLAIRRGEQAVEAAFGDPEQVATSSIDMSGSTVGRQCVSLCHRLPSYGGVRTTPHDGKRHDRSKLAPVASKPSASGMTERCTSRLQAPPAPEELRGHAENPWLSLPNHSDVPLVGAGRLLEYLVGGGRTQQQGLRDCLRRPPSPARAVLYGSSRRPPRDGLRGSGTLRPWKETRTSRRSTPSMSAPTIPPPQSTMRGTASRTSSRAITVGSTHWPRVSRTPSTQSKPAGRTGMAKDRSTIRRTPTSGPRSAFASTPTRTSLSSSTTALASRRWTLSIHSYRTSPQGGFLRRDPRPQGRWYHVLGVWSPSV